MKIAILILLIYSIFGIHLSLPIGYCGERKLTISTQNVCILIAIILYCIVMWQKGVNNE